VKNYVSNMLMKLGMSRRTEAAVFAVKAGVGRQQHS
jgi:DNA-binding NarL/FixJ family response regulator